MPASPLPLLPLILDDAPRGLRQALAQEGIPFRDRRPGPPQGRFLLFDSRNGAYRPLAAGQVAIDVDTLRDGLQQDPFAALVDQRSDRFAWQIAGINVSEEIARVDKRQVRRRVLERLRMKIERAGGIWLRVSAFPFPYSSAFNFRIDHDQYEPQHFAATLQAIVGNEHATSHFVNGAAYQPVGQALVRLRGLDVGSHGYWHHTYRTAEENRRNIGLGIHTLRSAGIEPSGFAAPHGRFNCGLLSALETLGISHSSEFGLAYDELPFQVGSGHLLQIPVHPVSLGIFLEAASQNAGSPSAETENAMAAAADAAADYFVGLAETRYRSGEPVFLYGHPVGRLGRYPQVLHRVFDAVSRFGALWKTTLGEFSGWWRLRSRVRLTVTRRKGRFVVSVDRKLPGYRVGIEYLRGKHIALMPLEHGVLKFSPEALAYVSRPVAAAVHPVRIDRPEGLRSKIRRFIDWERVTPVDQIGQGDWRNLTKRTLRRWWKP